MRLKKMLFATVLFGFGALLSAQEFKISADTDHPDGYYQKGETVVFRFTAKDKTGKPATVPVDVILFADGQPTKNMKLEVVDGKAELPVKLSQPGWTNLIAQVKKEIPAANGKTRLHPVSNQAEAGAIVDVNAILRGGKRPADFDAFWDKEIAALKKVPMNPKLVPVPLNDGESFGGKVKMWDVTLDCVGPRPARGYLAMPADAKPKSLPIIIIYQGAGATVAYHPSWYGDVAISLCFNKFGMPNDIGSTWAKTEFAEEINGYTRDNLDDRDKCFFKWMILRDLRAQEFAKSLPEWNGKVMILNGESLGGAQALICGALDPDVTFICACVPALCDHNGALLGRRNGWPAMWTPGPDGKIPNAKAEAISRASEYVNVVNFMSRLTPKTEVSIGTGLIDRTCPPSSVAAAYNAIPEGVTKHLWTNPKAGHGAGNGHGGSRIKDILGKL